ncbi:MAG TPA: class IV adenylate cyclase [Candidatus Paceibacterota bacterium]|nr:class IV adenylate cyclase [Candidatus Paceibacterota bacterium]
MHEVEVKAALSDKEGVMRALEERGCIFSAPLTENDTLYALQVGDMESYNRNANFLRIRERSNGDIVFTLKHHPDRHEGRPDSMPLEHETTIGSKEEMEQALLLMGYQEVVRTDKVRQKGRIGKWEVCVDDVEGLGSFIELEELTDGKETQRVIDEMLAFLAELGIARGDMFADRYDIALLKKRWGV